MYILCTTMLHCWFLLQIDLNIRNSSSKLARRHFFELHHQKNNTLFSAVGPVEPVLGIEHVK